MLLSKAVIGFTLSNSANGLSEKTIIWYKSNLKLFRKFVGDIPLEKITANLVREYLVSLRERNLSPRTIRGYYTSLSVFFTWCKVEGLIQDSPCRNINPPKIPKLIPEPFTKAEIKSLLKACKTLPEKNSIRTEAMILLLLDTGMRVGELLSLKLDDIDLDSGRAKVFGKGSKERFVYFSPPVSKAIWRYINLVRPDSEFLFATYKGTRIQHRRFLWILHELAKKSGVDKVHPHKFRRTFAIEFLRNGGNLFSLQEILGHESLEMVRRYVKVSSDDTANSHQKNSPVTCWKL